MVAYGRLRSPTVAYGRLRSPICREREPRICLSRSGTGRTVAEAVRLIPDAIRYAFRYHEADYARHLHQDVALTQQQGFELVRLRNFWPATSTRGSAACGATRPPTSSSRCSSTPRSA